MKILVTGGAGFIGSNTARALLKKDYEVVIIDDFNDRYDPRLKEARIDHMFKDVKEPKVIRGDIQNRELIDELFAKEKFDRVVHLAAWASVAPSLVNPYIYTSVNVDGTVNILEASRKNDIENVVFASTSSVYGGNNEAPFKEDADITSPLSPYAASKAAGEIMCATWNNIYGLPVSCMRFFTVYGPWGRPEMALFLFAKAISEGRPIQMRGADTQRDFTYIDDIVSGVVTAMETPRGFDVFNLGNNDSVPLPRLIATIEKALGKKAIIEEVPLMSGEIKSTLANIDHSKEVLGYQPTTSIEEGVNKFIDWYDTWKPIIKM